MARNHLVGTPKFQNNHNFTIGAVSNYFYNSPHGLRYWEQEFEELKPVRRRG
ncbi:MAG: MerR family transcriptional regulator, partial [Gammaproteobacteria bacterium]|nr:MerR family transcriptional regulator [Gammaproteobacteria bacterium]